MAALEIRFQNCFTSNISGWISISIYYIQVVLKLSFSDFLKTYIVSIINVAAW